MLDIEDLHKLHDAAVAANQPTYRDPSTGNRCFTAATLRKRGKCCGCGCRHCPFNHERVTMEDRPHRISAPALLAGDFGDLEGPVDVLLWSGGKDSFLAARALRREHGGAKNRLVLLTTFDAGSKIVAHQELPIVHIVRQARQLRVPLVGVPLWSSVPYETRVGDALRFVADAVGVRRVASGDLWLEHIAAWRETHLGPVAAAVGATLYAPLWRIPYAELLRDLEASATPIRVCAADGACAGIGVDGVGDPPPRCGAVVGELYDAAMRARLNPSADAMGEAGEFHTLAEVWDSRLDDPLGESVFAIRAGVPAVAPTPSTAEAMAESG